MLTEPEQATDRMLNSEVFAIRLQCALPPVGITSNRVQRCCKGFLIRLGEYQAT